MNDKRLSKFLSLILRHRPEKLGITLDKEGWANTQEIIDKMKQRGMPISLARIREVVQNNDKQRFKLGENDTKIRANQGHSVNINLAIEPTLPPKKLFHGTATKNLESILAQGIKKGSRQHVHLSMDIVTATKVGQRHGKPVILEVDAEQMSADNILFYQSENGVWLTDYIDPKYIFE